MKKRKVLIVKLGYTETLEKNWSTETVSLGDIFRTTPILHLFKNDYIVWLTTSEGKQLLEDNPYIDRLMIYDLTSTLQLQREQFDIIINLERVPGVCALTDSIPAWNRYGFRFDSQKGSSAAYDSAFDVISAGDKPELRKKMNLHWIEMLYQVLRKEWKSQSYILGYKPQTKESFDIGFNFRVGKKWPTKAWPMEYWKKLEKLIGKKHSISWQESPEDIKGYIDWLNKCKLIVTNDSLGLHLAIALKKKVVALFSSTPSSEVHLFGLGEKLTPTIKCKLFPCINAKCETKKNCIEKITPETVLESITKVLNNETNKNT